MEVISIRMPAILIEKANEYAEKRGIARTEAIRRACEAFFLGSLLPEVEEGLEVAESSA